MKRRLSIPCLALLLGGCGSAAQDTIVEHPGHPPKVARTSPRLDESQPDSEIEIALVGPGEARALEWASVLDALQGLESDEASMDIVADPNMRPIRVWFAKSKAGVGAVHIVGHADGECCPLISSLVQNVAMAPGFEDAWFSYGYGHLMATTAGEEAELDRLRQDITARASERACQGQVVLTTQQSDAIATVSAGLTAMGERAYARAAALGRPLLIWSHFDDHPRIVPALVPEGGGMKPLRVKVSKTDLSPPASVTSGLSMGRVAQGIASLEAGIVELTRLSQATNQIMEISGGQWTTNYRAPQMEPVVLAANGRIAAALATWQARPVSHPSRAHVLAELRKMQATNAIALKKIRALPEHAASDAATKIEYVDVALDEDAMAKIRARLAEAKAALARLRAMSVSPLARPEPVLTDALLRGWPASFSTPKAEAAFDKWVGERQKPVWAKVSRDLEARGVHLTASAAGAPAALTLSNVVFRVVEDGSDMVVTPYFILAGPVVQVVDPAAGIVRYEATAADQNLYDIGHQDEGDTQ